MIILVSYDLKSPGKNYSGLYETLKTAESWCHYLNSTWMIYTNEANALNLWSDRIKRTLDTNDSLFLVDITTKPFQGWLPKEAWEWIAKYNK